jgi:hypothetical protein
MKEFKNLVKLNIIYVLAFAFFLNIVFVLTGIQIPFKLQILFIYLLFIFLMNVDPEYDLLIAIVLIVVLSIPIFFKDRQNIDQIATFSYMFLALGILRRFLSEVYSSKSLIIRVWRKVINNLSNFVSLLFK